MKKKADDPVFEQWVSDKILEELRPSAVMGRFPHLRADGTPWPRPSRWKRLRRRMARPFSLAWYRVRHSVCCSHCEEW